MDGGGGWLVSVVSVLAQFSYMEGHTGIKKNNIIGTSKLFNQLNALRIIFLNNLLVPIIKPHIPCEWISVDVLVCFFTVGWWDKAGYGYKC